MAVNTKNAKTQFQTLLSSFLKHDVLTLGAALAFYTTLALAPLMIIFVSLAGLLGDEIKSKLLVNVHELLGENAAQAIQLIISNAENSPDTGTITGLVSILILIFSSSVIFSQIQTSLNIIFETPPQSDLNFVSWIEAKILSMGLVLAFLFLSMVSLALSIAISVLVDTSNGMVWELINILLSYITFCALFALIYKYVSNANLAWSQLIKGGMLTSFFFMIGKSLIGLYLGNSAVASAYGAAGSLVVFLMWVYYSSLVVFIGAELTHVWYPAKKSEPNEAEKCLPPFVDAQHPQKVVGTF